MKKITINESQLIKLIEMNTNSAPNYTNGDIKEFPSSEVSVTSNISNANGETIYGKPHDTDHTQKMLSPQNYWTNGIRGTKPI